jgi:ABC-type cobalt transport system substrate-binding protein
MTRQLLMCTGWGSEKREELYGLGDTGTMPGSFTCVDPSTMAVVPSGVQLGDKLLQWDFSGGSAAGWLGFPLGKAPPSFNGTANTPAVTCTGTTLSDTRASFTSAAALYVGQTLICGGSTMLITARTSTSVLTGAAWVGGQPADGLAYRLGTRFGVGAWMDPRSNPSSGTYEEMLYLDDGSLNGLVLCWEKASLKLSIRTFAGAVIGTCATAAPSATASYGGATGPPWYIQYICDQTVSVTADTNEIRTYQWNANLNRLILIETYTTTSAVRSVGPFYLRFGLAGAGGSNSKGAWGVPSTFDKLAAGDYGPISPRGVGAVIARVVSQQSNTTAMTGAVSGTANAAVTAPAGKLIDTRQNFAGYTATLVGGVVTCSSFTMTVTSISTTTNPNDTLNGSGGWSVGGPPGAGLAYEVVLVDSASNEWNYIKGTPTTTPALDSEYLTGGGTQFYGIETGKIPPGATVIGYTVMSRTRLPAGGGTATVQAKYSGGGSKASVAVAELTVWGYPAWVSDIYKPPGNTLLSFLVAADEDNMLIAHTEGGSAIAISQLFVTWLYLPAAIPRSWGSVI